jgi:histidine ammonia-lyase
MKEIVLDGESLSLSDLDTFLDDDVRVSASEPARGRVQVAAEFCEKISRSDQAHYGINTGFGSFANRRIDKKSLGQLQKNLLRSHATGMGRDLPDDIVRLMMLLRVNSLLRGFSGVSLAVVDHLLAFINRGVIPSVPEYGSVGASGDLAPLAHMALPLIGEGAACVGGKRMDGAAALNALGLKPLDLKPKEGLALINGTQLMSAYAVRELRRCRRNVAAGVIAASMSIEAYEATDAMFDERIHALKGHPGQIQIAAAFRAVLAASEIVASHRECDRVQDPYSFRCVPQVCGAVLDTVCWVEEWVIREINAVTDNPLVFVAEEDVVSGGNFHGEHMAIALDALAIAQSELGSISERRIDKLLDNDSEKLPQCLIRDPGLNSGLMVTQYLAASLVAENKVYAHPASVDSIPTSAGFEDHVSMGSISAFKLAKISSNVQKILAVELMCAAQALDYHRPLKAGRGTEVAHTSIRRRVPFIEQDSVLSDHLQAVEVVVSDGSLVREVERAMGTPLLDRRREE